MQRSHTSKPSSPSVDPHGLRYIAGAALAFQGLHFLEHAIQVVHWALQPFRLPYLTPWARAGRDSISALAGRGNGAGNEALHLLGNLIFLVGIIAFLVLLNRRHASRPARRYVIAGLAVQSVHVAEHVVLTTSVWILGEPWGMSTLFGSIDAFTTVGMAVRVWMHFALNAVSTLLVAAGVMAWWPARRRTARPTSQRTATSRPPQPLVVESA